jgi:hypothetical protein
MDTQRVIARTIEILGGRENAKQVTDAEFAGIQERWSQDVAVMGRILRAHLFVEHYLNEHLAKANPRLGSVEQAHLTFAQKVTLLNASDAHIRSVLPGIKHLNAIRTDWPIGLVPQLTLQTQRYS